VPLLIGLMVLGAVGGLFYFAHTQTAPAKPQLPPAPAPLPMSILVPGSDPSSLVSAQTGISWVAAGNVTNLDQGNLYRWSLARVSTRTQPQILAAISTNFDQAQAWVDSYPPDWPLDDRGPGRNRLQGIAKSGELLNGPNGTPDPTVLVWQGFPASSSPAGTPPAGPIAPPPSTTPGGSIA
jgi:hypothetical protein